MTATMLTDAGGTRAWRRLVAVVLERDAYTCRMRRDGHTCGAVATTANHKIARVDGGLDTMDNLEAACVPCNMGAGGRMSLLRRTRAILQHETVARLVTRLDEFGLAHDAGRRRAIAALERHGRHLYRRAEIDAACAYRLARGPLTRI